MTASVEDGSGAVYYYKSFDYDDSGNINEEIDRTGMQEYECLLNRHLKGNLPSDVIKIRGGPPGTSLIGPLE